MVVVVVVAGTLLMGVVVVGKDRWAKLKRVGFNCIQRRLKRGGMICSSLRRGGGNGED